MLNSNILFYVLGGVILFLCLRVYYISENLQLKCVISTVDGNKYCVRDRTKINEAVNLLAEVVNKMKRLVDYVYKKYPDDPDVIRLKNNFNPNKITETLPTSELTAYSENKGEKMAFCLNKTKNTETLIDVNTLTFVGIHELSHTMTKSIGHKQEFWQNFKFVLENAKEANIYQPVNYNKNPTEYCGMTIDDNPYFDFISALA
jgi:hypothetical protein